MLSGSWMLQETARSHMFCVVVDFQRNSSKRGVKTERLRSPALQPLQTSRREGHLPEKKGRTCVLPFCGQAVQSRYCSGVAVPCCDIFCSRSLMRVISSARS